MDLSVGCDCEVPFSQLVEAIGHRMDYFEFAFPPVSGMSAVMELLARKGLRPSYLRGEVARFNMEKRALQVKAGVDVFSIRVIPDRWTYTSSLEEVRRPYLFVDFVTGDMSLEDFDVRFGSVEYLDKDTSGESVIRIDRKVNYDYDEVIHHYQPELPLERNLRECNGTPATVDIQMDIVSLVHDEEVKLAPFLLVEVLRAERLGEDSAACEVVGKGDGGFIRWFLAVLTAQRMGPFRAPVFGFSDGKVLFENTPDFFRLRKGEREVFQLYVMQAPGYSYEFKVGVPFTYKGTEYVRWLPETFTVAMIEGPTRVIEVSGEDEPLREVHRTMTEHRSLDYVLDALNRGENKLKRIHGFETYWAGKKCDLTRRPRETLMQHRRH